MNGSYPNAPGWKGASETGREAAEAMASAAGRLQRLALGAIRDAGDHGLTADELAARLDVERWSVQPRTSELRRKHLIKDSGQRRRNATGRRAIVWCATDPAEMEARA